VLINLRSRTHAGAVALSGFVQSTGYLVAAAGPHPQLDRDDFTRRVFLNEDADAVVEDVTGWRLEAEGLLGLARARAGDQGEPAKP
jgi:hypothetical protein